jgi:outer membrane translocation and assembly module TamA
MEFKYSSTSIFEGSNAAYVSTTSLYSNSTLPGVNGAQLVEISIFGEYDSRIGRPATAPGLYVRAGMSSVDGVNGSDFSYWRYNVDQRFYLPLGSRRRMFAARTLLAVTDRRDGSQLPFFRMPHLGDTETLRGYDPNRFRGLNAASWNVEYRTQLTGGLGAFAYTDFGQVFDRASEFNTRNFKVTYGGGLQLMSKGSAFLRTYWAHSPERSRLMITFGKTF